MEAVWTIFGTVISGVFVYVVSEYIHETSSRRIREYQDIRRRVAYMLTMYACHYTNVTDETESEEKRKKVHEESQDMRKTASELRAFCETLPDGTWLFKKQIPPKKDLFDASAFMIGISNSFFQTNRSKEQNDFGVSNSKKAEEIYKLLKLNVLPEEVSKKKNKK